MNWYLELFGLIQVVLYAGTGVLRQSTICTIQYIRFGRGVRSPLFFLHLSKQVNINNGRIQQIIYHSTRLASFTIQNVTASTKSVKNQTSCYWSVSLCVVRQISSSLLQPASQSASSWSLKSGVRQAVAVQNKRRRSVPCKPRCRGRIGESSFSHF